MFAHSSEERASYGLPGVKSRSQASMNAGKSSTRMAWKLTASRPSALRLTLTRLPRCTPGGAGGSANESSSLRRSQDSGTRDRGSLLSLTSWMASRICDGVASWKDTDRKRPLASLILRSVATKLQGRSSSGVASRYRSASSSFYTP